MIFFTAYFLLGCIYTYFYINSSRWVNMQFFAQQAIEQHIDRTPNIIKSEKDKLQMLQIVLDLIIAILLFIWPIYIIKDILRGFK